MNKSNFWFWTYTITIIIGILIIVARASNTYLLSQKHQLPIAINFEEPCHWMMLHTLQDGNIRIRFANQYNGKAETVTLEKGKNYTITWGSK